MEPYKVYLYYSLVLVMFVGCIHCTRDFMRWLWIEFCIGEYLTESDSWHEEVLNHEYLTDDELKFFDMVEDLQMNVLMAGHDLNSCEDFREQLLNISS